MGWNHLRKVAWSKAYVKKLATAVLATFLTVLFVDFVARYGLGVEPPGYRPERYYQFSILTGHFSRPNAKVYFNRYDDGRTIYIRTNSFGFTDKERSIQKTRPRVVLVGDSTTAQWEVAENHRAQFVIEDLLDGRFEVLNFGVRGYGTDQTYILFKHVGVHFSPDIVIYTFCINDLRNNVKRDSKPYFVIDPSKSTGLDLQGYPIAMRPRAKRRDLADRLFGSSFTYRQVRRFLNDLFYDPTPLERHFELRPYKEHYDDEDSYRMELTLRLISLFDAFVKSHGMRFLVLEGIYRPTIDDAAQAEATEVYGDIFDFDKVSAILASHCERNGIAFLSLSRLFRAQGARGKKVMHSKDQLHLNKRGVELFSAAVVEKLSSLGWLDGDMAIVLKE